MIAHPTLEALAAITRELERCETLADVQQAVRRLRAIRAPIELVFEEHTAALANCEALRLQIEFLEQNKSLHETTDD